MQQNRTFVGAALAATCVGLGLLACRQAQQDDLYQEVALVTGGSRGLGFLIARELGRQGCRVAICARNERELAVAQADLAREGIDAFALPCDVTNPDAIRATVARVTAHFGRIDLLVNNAGIIQVGPFDQMTESHFRQAMAVMFWAHYYMTEAVLPQMVRRQHGRIVNITSIGGVVSVPHLLPYSVAKFAATGFSQGLRAELKHKGIYVTTVAPSTLRTGSHLQAQVTGDHMAEYTWFGLSATLPIISTSAAQAAHAIVDAVKRRAAFHYVGWPARVAGRLHGLLPGLTADLLGLVKRYALPDSPAGPMPTLRGRQIDAQLTPAQQRWRHLLMMLGQQAAQRYHQSAADAPSTVAKR